jgi:prophage antirepressor-like protein
MRPTQETMITPSDTLTLTYPAHDGHTHPVTAVRCDGEFFFPFTELAQALLYECPDRMRPTCDEVEIRTLPFAGKRYPRKCVTREGLFAATPASRTDDWSEAAYGPAIHFHRWLRAVMLPAIESEEWPPSETMIRTLQIGWLTTERERIDAAIKALGGTAPEPADTAQKPKAALPKGQSMVALGAEPIRGVQATPLEFSPEMVDI